MSNEKTAEIIRQSLEDMVGHKYKYGGAVHTINSYQVLEDKERIVVQTNIRTFERNFESALDFINQLEPYNGNRKLANISEEVTLPKLSVNNNVMTKLTNVLLDNIETLKKDKSFIEQAEAIRDNVDSIIEIAKTETAYMEAFVRMHKL